MGDKLPIPNGYKNISDILKIVSAINVNIREEDLISILIRSNFKKNKEMVEKLVTLPHIKKNKDFILKLVNEVDDANFSFLANTPKEQIEAEKTKIYKKIILNCK